MYGWALAQAAAVRDGRWTDIDVDNLSEEIDDMAGSLKRQPERDSSSWSLTIAEQSRRIADLLEESPSLRRCCLRSRTRLTATPVTPPPARRASTSSRSRRRCPIVSSTN